MSSLWRLWVLCGMLSLLWGCPHHHRPASRGVTIASGVTIPLLPASALGRSLAASQRFTSHFRGKQQTLYFQVEVEPRRIAMVGLTPVGVRLFVLQYQGGKVLYQPQPFFKAPLQPRHILADFQLVYWPLATLQAALGPQGIRIRERQTGQGRERIIQKQTGRLTRQPPPIIVIQYQHASHPWRGKVSFQHKERGYRFTIETRQVQALPPKP